jgi:hypothetical protein
MKPVAIGLPHSGQKRAVSGNWRPQYRHHFDMFVLLSRGDEGLFSDFTVYRTGDRANKGLATAFAKKAALIVVPSSQRGELKLSRFSAPFADMPGRRVVNGDGLAKIL